MGSACLSGACGERRPAEQSQLRPSPQSRREKRCRFDGACRRWNCDYMHELKPANIEGEGFCRFGNQCKRLGCFYRHPQVRAAGAREEAAASPLWDESRFSALEQFVDEIARTTIANKEQARAAVTDIYDRLGGLDDKLRAELEGVSDALRGHRESLDLHGAVLEKVPVGDTLENGLGEVKEVLCRHTAELERAEEARRELCVELERLQGRLHGRTAALAEHLGRLEGRFDEERLGGAADERHDALIGRLDELERRSRAGLDELRQEIDALQEGKVVEFGNEAGLASLCRRVDEQAMRLRDFANDLAAAKLQSSAAEEAVGAQRASAERMEIWARGQLERVSEEMDGLEALLEEGLQKAQREFDELLRRQDELERGFSEAQVGRPVACAAPLRLSAAAGQEMDIGPRGEAGAGRGCWRCGDPRHRRHQCPLHLEEKEEEEGLRRRGLCIEFSKRSSCVFGDACRFHHRRLSDGSDLA